MDTIDPDFARLMEGTVKLADLTPEKQEAFRVWVNGQPIGFESIKDPATRRMMEKWDALF